MKIKVIKKGAVKPIDTIPAVEKRKKKEAAREMVSNVTNWVSEFQNRKREETKIAIETFFKQPSQVS